MKAYIYSKSFFFSTKELGIIVWIRNLTNVNLIVNNYRFYIKIIIYNKNCTKVSIFEKINDLEKSLALEHFLWKGKVLIKTGCTPKKSQFYSLQTLKKF